MDDETKEFLVFISAVILAGTVILLFILSIPFLIYLFFGYLDWLVSDPFHLFTT